MPDTTELSGKAAYRAITVPVIARAAMAVGATLVVVAAVRLALDGTVAVMDLASIEMRTRDVGTSATPLVGPYSRFGFFFPGPLLYWVLAVPYRVLGATSIHAAAGVVAAIALLLTAWSTRMVRDQVFPAIVAFVMLVLFRASGPDLFSAWNPHLPALWMPLFALLSWRVAVGEIGRIPLAVAAGSLLVQCHLQYGVIVTSLLAWAAVIGIRSWIRESRDEKGGTSSDNAAPSATYAAKMVALSVLVGLLLWSGPIIQHINDEESNFENIIGYLTDPEPRVDEEKTYTNVEAIRVVGHVVGPTGVWVSGDKSASASGTAIELAIPALLLGSLVALGAVLRRRREREAALLAFGAAVTLVASVIQVTTLKGIAIPYLTRFLWPVGAVIWIALLFGVYRLVADRTPSLTVKQVGVGLSAATCLLGVAMGAEVLGAQVDDHADAKLVRNVVALTESTLGRDVGVLDAQFFGPSGFVQFSLRANLEQHGYTVAAIPTQVVFVGSARAERVPDYKLLVIEGYEVEAWSPRWDHEPGLKFLGLYETPDGAAELASQQAAVELLTACRVNDVEARVRNRNYAQLRMAAEGRCPDAVSAIDEASAAWVRQVQSKEWGRYAVVLQTL